MSLTDRSIGELKAQESWKGTTLVGFAAASLTPFMPSGLAPLDNWNVNTHRQYEIQIVSNAVSHVTKLEIKSQASMPAYIPRTALGERLLALRNKAIANGMRLLSTDEVIEEVARRRGEIV